jgi:hypothetical protein
MNDLAQGSPPAICKRCGQGPASQPKLSALSSYCSTCWEAERDALRGAPVSIQFVRKGPSVCEYALVRQGKPVGRLILYRDSTTLCVRFFSLLNGESEIVLEEILTRLGFAERQGSLDVHVLHAQGESESLAIGEPQKGM